MNKQILATSTRIFSLVMAMSMFLPQFAISAHAATNFDLSSTSHNLPAPNAGTIHVGGHAQAVHVGQLVTPAELAVLSQITDTGRQSLVLGALGNAIGGKLNIVDSIGSNLGSLLIPHGVTALSNFTQTSILNLSSDLTNSGNLYAYSTIGGNTAAMINANNIYNNHGAVISTVLPTGKLGLQNTLSSLDLTLNALGDIINAGTISSSGALTLSVGGTITNALSTGTTGTAPTITAVNDLNLSALGGTITNSGRMASTFGNINVLNTMRDVNFNGTGGTLNASAGNINIHDASFSGNSSVNLIGGSWLSQNLNIFAGSGDIEGSLGKVSGSLNTQAGVEHLLADTATLTLATNTVTGDPTFVNTGGDIVIGGLVQRVRESRCNRCRQHYRHTKRAKS